MSSVRVVTLLASCLLLAANARAAGDCGTGALCGAVCVSLATDNANCGKCGLACPGGQACKSGACAPVCGTGTTLCGSTCNDTSIDNANCGGCGKACKASETCSGGACGTSCAAGEKACGEACIDTRTDHANCGACGTTCGAGQNCVRGSCVTNCDATMTLCAPLPSQGGGTAAPACKNLAADDGNCGNCGNACALDERCSSGYCCPAGQSTCGGPCEDLSTDPNNCGACGVVCSGQNPDCLHGTCGKEYLLRRDNLSGASPACRDPATGWIYGYGIGPPHFSWTDTGTGTVASIELSANITRDLGSQGQGKAVSTVLLNPAAGQKGCHFDPTPSCVASYTDWTSTSFCVEGFDNLLSFQVPSASLSVYNVGGVNTAIFSLNSYSGSFFAGPVLVTYESHIHALGRVFVRYQ